MTRFVVFIGILSLGLWLFSGWTERAKAASPNVNTSDSQSMKTVSLTGPSIQVDPGFPYYQGRSVESIADEIALAGYRSVHYFVTNENIVNGDLIDAFHAKGIAVWALVLGNGTYSTDRFPEEWPDWQMGLLKPVNDGYVRLSPFSPGYREWKKAALARLVTEYAFDGIEVAEPYFPEWTGLESGVYGDVGPLAKAAFREQYNSEIPDFVNAASPNYYRTNTKLYEKWVEFRVDAVNAFLNELMNGKGGVREARPDILVATWSLAIDAGRDSVSRLRELQGLDAAAMVSAVRPEIHFFQTHWPDWVKPSLAPNYPTRYTPFVDQLRATHPAIPIGIQADIGSVKTMLRSRDWLNSFMKTIDELGYATWTAYEYHLGKYMYTEKPVPVEAKRGAPGWIIVWFNKRIDSFSASQLDHYLLVKDGQTQPLSLEDAVVDGNRILLHSSDFPDGSFAVEFRDIEDTPDLWLYKGYPANKVPPGSRIKVPAAQ